MFDIRIQNAISINEYGISLLIGLRLSKIVEIDVHVANLCIVLKLFLSGLFPIVNCGIIIEIGHTVISNVPQRSSIVSMALQENARSTHDC